MKPILWLLFFLISRIEAINWNGNNWASGCTFNSKDIAKALVPSTYCSSKCAQTLRCTHFVWTSEATGTCYLKEGPVSKWDAIPNSDHTSVCGLLAYKKHNGDCVQWNGNDWAPHCEFSGGNELKRVNVPASYCGGQCVSTPGCTHFSWSAGTCKLNGGTVRKVDAFIGEDETAVCGVVSSNGQSDLGCIYWNGNIWAHACDFKGNDISKAYVPAKLCWSTCGRTAGCTHFSWKPENGGTCFLKSGHVSYTDAFAIADQSSVCGLIPPGSNGTVDIVSFTSDSYLEAVNSRSNASKKHLIVVLPLECTDYDPEESFVLNFNKTENLTVSYCDLCPSLPFDKLNSVMIDNIDPYRTFSDLDYSDCVFSCIEQSNQTCMALSYDSILSKCYQFNTTVNSTYLNLVPEFTSVLINQPLGLIGDWTFNRNTRVVSINGDLESVHAETFNDCLIHGHTSEKIAVSFDLTTKECSIFDWHDSFNIALEYGSVSGFHLNFLNKQQDNEWRFVSVDFGNFSESDNQTMSTEMNAEKPSEACLKRCARRDDCILIGHSKHYVDEDGCQLFDYKDVLFDLDYRKPTFFLQQPYNQSRIDFKFKPHFGYSLTNNFNISLFFNLTLVQCMNECLNSQKKSIGFKCQGISFNFVQNQCKISIFSNMTNPFIHYMKDRDSILFYYFPSEHAFDPTVLAFKEIVGATIDYQKTDLLKSISLENSTLAIKHCLDQCLLNNSCDFVELIQITMYNFPVNVCHLYTINVNIENSKVVFNSIIFSKLNKQAINIDQSYLDRLFLFQANDIPKCFRHLEKPEHVNPKYMNIYNFDVGLKTENQLLIRQKRGKGAYIARQRKARGESIMNGPKLEEVFYESSIKPFVKAGETIYHLARGDSDAAKDSAREIPLVKNIEDTYKSGKKAYEALKKKDFSEMVHAAFEIYDNFRSTQEELADMAPHPSKNSFQEHLKVSFYRQSFSKDQWGKDLEKKLFKPGLKKLKIQSQNQAIVEGSQINLNQTIVKKIKTEAKKMKRTMLNKIEKKKAKIKRINKTMSLILVRKRTNVNQIPKKVVQNVLLNARVLQAAQIIRVSDKKELMTAKQNAPTSSSPWQAMKKTEWTEVEVRNVTIKR